MHQQPWFVPFVHKSEEHLGCWENYTMFAISSFQYIILAFVFSKGAPYRRPIWSNIPFCLTLIVNLCIVVYLVLYPTDWLANFFQLIVPPEMGFRYWMIIYGAGNFVAHVVVETLIVEYLLFKKYQSRREKDMRTSKRKYMHIEYDLKFYKNWPQITEEHAYGSNDAAAAGRTEKTNPAYFEISAEQNFDTPASDDNPLSNFFDLDMVNTPTSTMAPAAAAVLMTQIPETANPNIADNIIK